MLRDPSADQQEVLVVLSALRSSKCSAEVRTASQYRGDGAFDIRRAGRRTGRPRRCGTSGQPRPSAAQSSRSLRSAAPQPLRRRLATATRVRPAAGGGQGPQTAPVPAPVRRSTSIPLRLDLSPPHQLARRQNYLTRRRSLRYAGRHRSPVDVLRIRAHVRVGQPVASCSRSDTSRRARLQPAVFRRHERFLRKLTAEAGSKAPQELGRVAREFEGYLAKSRGRLGYRV